MTEKELTNMRIEAEEAKLVENEINETNNSKNKNALRDNQLNFILKTIMNPAGYRNLDFESEGEKSGRDRQNSSENLEIKEEDFVPFSFENRKIFLIYIYIYMYCIYINLYIYLYIL
jgi:hypothetical protein